MTQAQTIRFKTTIEKHRRELVSDYISGARSL